MIDLDSQKEIEKFDKGKILASIRMLPDQIQQAWEEINSLAVPKACYLSKNIVICGMGGSALGGRIVDSLMVNRVRVPIEVFTEYDIPNYVGPDTLVIATSYSGNTEETLNAVHEALKKGAKIFGITTGGKLAELLKKEKISSYVYKPLVNPSGQPRMGLGYSIGATLAILAKCGFIHFSEDNLYDLATTARDFTKEFDVDNPLHKNLAKHEATILHNKIPVLVSSEHLFGVAHSLKNQLNESSKVFSVVFDIPELNHHLLEGLKFPAKARGLLYFLFYESSLYRKELIQRYKITKDVVGKCGYGYSVYEPSSKKKITQIFEALVFGSFVSFYLAVLYGVDPSKIPWVDYFKEKLAKQ